MSEFASTPAHSFRSFIAELFTVLPRVDQRRWAGAYLEGFIATPGKKTLRRIAAAVSASDTAAQSMHQFINASPWDWEPIRDELARWATYAMSPDALVIDLAYIRKRGMRSCGVHTRFVPSLGRAVSCQVGVAAVLASAEGAVPVDWRLHLPAAWLENEEDRLRAKIPEHVAARGIAQQALDMIDAMDRRTWAPALPVVGDFSGADDVAVLAHGLACRGSDFVIAIPPGTRVRTEHGYDGPVAGLPATGRNTVRMVAHRAHRQAPVLSATAVRLPGGVGAGTGREYQVLVAHSSAGGPPRWWLSNLTDVRRIAPLAGRLDRSVRVMRDLEENFGLGDFEGRSFLGWHHHTTLVSVAYAWQQLHAMAALGKRVPA